MIGAIIGDVVGSRYEFINYKSKDFELFNKVCCFTDDTVCTVAVAETLLNNYPFDLSEEGKAKIQKELVENLTAYVKKYPDVGYGGKFYNWAIGSDHEPYNSWGNGAAMRISSVGWLANSEEEVKELSKLVTEVTHNHPEGIKGAEVVAMCIYMARNGKTKKEICDYVIKEYPLIKFLEYDNLVANYRFDVSCSGSVPHAIYSFLISKDFEDALKTAVSIGGDSDTIACIAGSIAEAYYKDEKTQMVISEFMNRNYIPDSFINISLKLDSIKVHLSH